MVRCIIILLLCSIGNLSFADVCITACPMESNVDYYSLSVDGEEFTLDPVYDMNFLYCIDHFEKGNHEIILKSGNIDGESSEISFIVKKSFNRGQTKYEIKIYKDCKKEPNCKALFDEPLRVTVPNNNSHKPRPRKPRRPRIKGWR